MTKFESIQKVNESFNVYRYDNGWMVEVSGRDKESEYVTAKIICNSEAEVVSLFTKFNEKEIDR